MTYHKVWTGRIRLGLDNEATIKQIKATRVLSPKAKSVDLITDIRRKSPNFQSIKIEHFWIKGHAAEMLGSKTYEQYLNHLCD